MWLSMLRKVRSTDLRCSLGGLHEQVPSDPPPPLIQSLCRSLVATMSSFLEPDADKVFSANVLHT